MLVSIIEAKQLSKINVERSNVAILVVLEHNKMLHWINKQQ